MQSAADALRKNPTVAIRSVASRLDVSERHLRRRFDMSLGVTPKQFARIVRVGKVVAAARNGRDWADIAALSGFSDQSHMIHDFNSMIGVSPDLLFRTTSLGLEQKTNISAAESDFYNTFITDASRPN